MNWLRFRLVKFSTEFASSNRRLCARLSVPVGTWCDVSFALTEAPAWTASLWTGELSTKTTVSRGLEAPDPSDRCVHEQAHQQEACSEVQAG